MMPPMERPLETLAGANESSQTQGSLGATKDVTGRIPLILLSLSAVVAVVGLVLLARAVRPATDEYAFAAAVHLVGPWDAFAWYMTNWYPYVGVYALQMGANGLALNPAVALPLVAAIGLLLLVLALKALVAFVVATPGTWKPLAAGITLSAVAIGGLSLGGLGGAPSIWLVQPYTGLRAAPILLAIAMTPWLIETRRSMTATVAVGAAAGVVCSIWSPVEGASVGLWWLGLAVLSRKRGQRSWPALVAGGLMGLVGTAVIVLSPGSRVRSDFTRDATVKQFLYDMLQSLHQSLNSISSWLFIVLLILGGLAVGWILEVTARRAVVALVALIALAAIHLTLHTMSEAYVYIGEWHLPPISALSALVLICAGLAGGGTLRARAAQRLSPMAESMVSVALAAFLLAAPLTIAPALSAFDERASAWAQRSAESLAHGRQFTTLRLKAPDGRDLAPDLRDKTSSIRIGADYGQGFMDWAYASLPLGY